MASLIDDLLHYSQVSQKPREIEAIDLNKKLALVLEDLELDIEQKGAFVYVHKLPTVRGYRRQLQQLFQNLVTNALKYTSTGVAPKINISAELINKSGKEYHLIRVTDNGIGFDAAYSEKIFQLFTRLHGNGEYSGSGIGLSIVKKIVENHQGIVTAESTPGAGSTFAVYLPVR